MGGAVRSIMFAAAILCFAGAARAELVAPGAKPEKLGSGYKFTEGPAADKDGNVYFTDIPNSRIHKWALDGTITLVRENTGAANGLYFDKDGNLLACEGGAGRVTKMDPSGKVTSIAEKFNGQPFNSPNDLWIDPKGGVYFTDPRYGDESNLPQGSQQVYYIAPGGKGVARATEDMKKPNGIIGTPDGKILYVADHGAKKTWKYSIGADGKLGDKTEFIQSGSDGMTLDEKGNLYLTTERVEVYDPAGKKIQDIEVPEVPANVTFGGADRKTLFMTARTSVYALKMSVRGAY